MTWVAISFGNRQRGFTDAGVVCIVSRGKSDSSAETRSLVHVRGQLLRLRSDGPLVVLDRDR